MFRCFYFAGVQYIAHFMVSECCCTDGANQQHPVKYFERNILVLLWNTLPKMINSAVNRHWHQKLFRNDSSSCSAYTSLIISHTLIFNRGIGSHSGCAQSNTLWMNVDLCQAEFTSHQYIAAVENPQRAEWLQTQTCRHHLHVLQVTPREDSYTELKQQRQRAMQHASVHSGLSHCASPWPAEWATGLMTSLDSLICAFLLIEIWPVLL